MGIISGLLGFLGCGDSKTENKVTAIDSSGYKLYVQFVNKKELKEDSKVKMKGKVIGKVIGLEQNPDAYIVTILINEEVDIPLLSKFKIKAETYHINFIDIEQSNDNRLLRGNEYFSGEE